MSDIDSASSYEAASARLERALGRLETAAGTLGEQAQSVEIVLRQFDQLQADKNRLTQDLAQTSAKAERLDDSAAQVSRRLVDAMETVKTVLAK